MKTLRTLCLIGLTVSLAAQGRRPPNVVVIVDAGRGALVRWSMPKDAFPPGGFQLARMSRGGTPRVLAAIRPGDPANAPALAPERQKAARDFLAMLQDSAKLQGEAADNARLAVQLAVASDPDLAAFLALSYEDRDAPQGETVTYTVSRLDATGRVTGAFASSAPTLIAPTRPPDPPQDLRAEVTRAGVAFFWSAPAPTAGAARAFTYEIRKREGGRVVLVTPRPVLRLTSPEKEFAGAGDAHPAVEATTAYTITALDLFGRRGPESKPIDVFAPDFTALDPPSSVIATSSQGKALVTWQAPANANRKGWKVVRSTQPDGIGPILTSAPAEMRLINSGVTAGTTYYYRVTAVNRRDEEGKPYISPAVVIRSARPPAPPTKLEATVKTGRVIITWIPSTDVVAGYQVQRSPDAREWTLLTSIAGSEPRYVDAVPSDTTGTLHYRVIAWSRDDTPSAPSTPLVVTLPDHDPPATPILQSIDGTGGAITLRFIARGGVGDATQYVVLRGDAENEPGIVVGSGALVEGAQTFVDSEVLAGGLYFYRLVAMDAAGNRSEPSDPANAIRAGSPPLPKPAPPKARFELKPFRRVAIDVPPSPNASVLCAIERRVGDARWQWILGPLPSTTTRAFDNTPPKSGTVAYRLVSISIDGTAGQASEEAIVIIP